MGKKDKSPYPSPKKGERLKCLACGGSGQVYNRKTGTKSCSGCSGKGYIQV